MHTINGLGPHLDLRRAHKLHSNDQGFFAYRAKGSDDRWNTFIDDIHFISTVHDPSGEWEIQFFVKA